MDLELYKRVVGSTSEEFAATGLDIGMLFPWQILKMNKMYELPAVEYPTLDELGESPVLRMEKFLKTLKKEMDEGLEILALLKARDYARASEPTDDNSNLVGGLDIQSFTHVLVERLLEAGIDEARINSIKKVLSKVLTDSNIADDELDRRILVMIADWLGDMQVFNRSEALKYGIPLESVLNCIMGSNFTKLGDDGRPIKDENGKFLKGPNFLPPEDHIYVTLFSYDQLNAELDAKIQEASSFIEDINTLVTPTLSSYMSNIFSESNGDSDEDDEEDEDYEEGDDDEDEDLGEGDDESLI